MNFFFCFFKDYLIRKLRLEQKQIDEDQSDIRKFRQESEGIAQKIKELETGFVEILYFSHRILVFGIISLVQCFVKMPNVVPVKWI